MGTNFEVFQRGSAIVYGGCGGIWVMTLFAKPSLADLLLARPSLRAMRDRHPGGFPTLTWILPEAGLSMESDARQEAATVTREYSASILAMATLIEGTGFQAAAVRAIVAGIDLVSRAPAPKRVFADVANAVAWCATMRPERDRLAGAVDGVAQSLATMRKGLTATSMTSELR